jgi:hypothetical protein
MPDQMLVSSGICWARLFLFPIESVCFTNAASSNHGRSCARRSLRNSDRGRGSPRRGNGSIRRKTRQNQRLTLGPARSSYPEPFRRVETWRLRCGWILQCFDRAASSRLLSPLPGNLNGPWSSAFLREKSHSAEKFALCRGGWATRPTAGVGGEQLGRQDRSERAEM